MEQHYIKILWFEMNPSLLFLAFYALLGGLAVYYAIFRIKRQYEIECANQIIKDIASKRS